GAQVNYGGGTITQQSKGAHTIKSSTFAHSTGGDGDVNEIKFPSTSIETDERIILYHSQTGEPVKGRRYKLTMPDGRNIEGTTDDQGRTQLATAQEFGDVEVLIYPEEA
ncbi:MAG: type VI secretion system tip protein VgrG, partial [Pseudomonadota bacterium]